MAPTPFSFRRGLTVAFVDTAHGPTIRVTGAGLRAPAEYSRRDDEPANDGTARRAAAYTYARIVRPLAVAA